jgi:hypothetical protein
VSFDPSCFGCDCASQDARRPGTPCELHEEGYVAPAPKPELAKTTFERAIDRERGRAFANGQPMRSPRRAFR